LDAPLAGVRLNDPVGDKIYVSVQLRRIEVFEHNRKMIGRAEPVEGYRLPRAG
jgi:hypothetical protein